MESKYSLDIIPKPGPKVAAAPLATIIRRAVVWKYCMANEKERISIMAERADIS